MPENLPKNQLESSKAQEEQRRKELLEQKQHMEQYVRRVNEAEAAAEGTKEQQKKEQSGGMAILSKTWKIAVGTGAGLSLVPFAASSAEALNILF